MLSIRRVPFKTSVQFVPLTCPSTNCVHLLGARKSSGCYLPPIPWYASRKSVSFSVFYITILWVVRNLPRTEVAQTIKNLRNFIHGCVENKFVTFGETFVLWSSNCFLVNVLYNFSRAMKSSY